MAAKKKAAAKKAAPKPRAAAAPSVEGLCRAWSWQWFAAAKGGRIVVEPVSGEGHRVVSLAIDVGAPIESVSGEVEPKVAGSCIYLRANGGAYSFDVVCASAPASEPAVQFWEP